MIRESLQAQAFSPPPHAVAGETILQTVGLSKVYVSLPQFERVPKAEVY
ncbi:hypothetical protein KDW_04990 [Dictyobacter vulcani]|uniref:Uncharacterized protein n=1 Tax=Dictyobacter vulcani TaxID=2607529 RepID=A0A5J4KIQ0_9CHLR|nr:hypothetical protein [Dictyobacter vulcani]GER86337.1 hypothetical protein KDW_04990 [Dictyobacter vulcani]